MIFASGGYIADTRTVGPPPAFDNTGNLLPPQDIDAHVFSCCAACAITELNRRCTGCPRGTASSKLVERIRKCQG
jgi:hypothetical protein